MVFSSLTFIFYFLPITLVLYYLVKGQNAKNLVLLILSVIFYAWGEPLYVIIILLSIINDYTFSNLIQRLRENNSEKKNLEKLYFIISVVINLGLLTVFKYGDFIIDNINYVFNTHIPNANLPLPLGISFYTFQTMSYSIDVYRGRLRAQKNFLTLATYVALFPQLIAGPIVRYRTIEEELSNRKATLDDISYGFRRFIVGLGKKVIIANQMGIIVDSIYNADIITTSTPILWLAAIGYFFQVYFDFSGYSDMAIGLGRMFGFHFLENFNYPYMATCATDFLRRWHISLGTWFKDYVYIPLGGNRKRRIFNIIVVFFLTGLWHGASWNYIIWGLYYGFFVIIEKMLKIEIEVENKFKYLIRRIIALIIIIIGATIFRLENFQTLVHVLKYLFVFDIGNLKNFVFDYNGILYALPFLILAIIGSSPLVKNIYEKNKEKKYGKYLMDFCIVIIFIITIQFLEGSSFNPFIYFRF